MGTGKGLLDSLIAEGGVKSRDLSWVIYIGVVIEIRRARSDRNAAKFYGYPYFTFYLKNFFALTCSYKNYPAASCVTILHFAPSFRLLLDQVF